MLRHLAAVLLLCCFAYCCAGDSPSTLSITVTDEMGAVIANAKTLILWDPASSRTEENTNDSGEVRLKTDARGLSNARLNPGFNDLFVSSPAFTPECQKVRIKLGPPVKIVIQLKVDPLVSAEIGHEIKGRP